MPHLVNDCKQQSGAQIAPDHVVDAKGLKCPMPVIKLQQQVRRSAVGELIAIECTDPGAEKDINSWARVNKHSLQSVTSTDYGCKIVVKVEPKQ